MNRPNPRLALAVTGLLLALAPTGHAATNLFPGPDQQAPGAFGNNAANPLTPEGLTGGPRSIFRRELLLGDLGDARNQLLYRFGVAISPTYIGEVQGNPTGGVEHGVTYDGVLNVALDVDLERLTRGVTPDLTLHANALWLQGQGLSTRKVGDFSNVSNISGYNGVRLQELWLEQSFWRKRASLRLGLLAADAEFFVSSYGSLFLNGTFGAFTFLGANVPNAPVYPLAAPGIRIAVQPTSKFLFQAGIWTGDAGAQDDNNKHGTAFRFNSRDGALILSEVHYLLNQSPGDRGLVGTYKLGAFVHTGTFTTFESQSRADLGTGSAVRAGDNYGVYGILDQQLLRAGGRSVGLFVRAGSSRDDRALVDWYVDGGFNFTGFVPGRVRDVAGIGVARSSVSERFSDAQQAAGAGSFSGETVLEVTYKAVLAPWWTVQPDFQYVFNPSGQRGSRDAAVFGVRTAVAF